ncbi:MAG: hypothetical protein Q8N99_05915 [Nanoarchaeota archaeon]|nr:hypothetical protein [Nanoarchaeota archaeon]
MVSVLIVDYKEQWEVHRKDLVSILTRLDITPYTEIADDFLSQNQYDLVIVEPYPVNLTVLNTRYPRGKTRKTALVESRNSRIKFTRHAKKLNIPVLVVSAMNREKLKQQYDLSEYKDYQGYLRKPLEFSDLMKIIKTLTNNEN